MEKTRDGFHIENEKMWYQGVCLDPWPLFEGLGENNWNFHANLFVLLMLQAQYFWVTDTELKYLNLRIDTRNDRFLVYIDDYDGEKIKISPDRVLAAIKKSW